MLQARLISVLIIMIIVFSVIGLLIDAGTSVISGKIVKENSLILTFPLITVALIVILLSVLIIGMIRLKD